VILDGILVGLALLFGDQLLMGLLYAETKFAVLAAYVSMETSPLGEVREVLGSFVCHNDLS
jgi:hypothetical protein